MEHVVGYVDLTWRLPPLFFQHCTPETRTVVDRQTSKLPNNQQTTNKNWLLDFDLQNWFEFISLVLVSWFFQHQSLQANRGNQLVSNLSSGAPLDAAIWASCIEAATKSYKAQLLMFWEGWFNGWMDVFPSGWFLYMIWYSEFIWVQSLSRVENYSN